MIMVSLREPAPDITLVGGKAFNLMKLKDVRVPDGVCLTTAAYDLFCRTNNLSSELDTLAAATDYENPGQLRETANRIRTLIMEGGMPEEILEVLNILSYKNVVVRSSATLEDLPQASFAGQQETVFNPETLEDGDIVTVNGKTGEVRVR
ncbi:MAG: PEP/pyruvate-binding domain-containing protein [Candidatus Methanofastidiosia archaeon]